MQIQSACQASEKGNVYAKRKILKKKKKQRILYLQETIKLVFISNTTWLKDEVDAMSFC